MIPRPRALAFLGLLCLGSLSFASCGNDARTWRQRMTTDEDPFERYMAALALCEDYPGRSGPAILAVFEGLESGVPLYEAGSRRALARLEQHKLPKLLELLVVAGHDRPLVRSSILPMLERAGEDGAMLLLAVLAENDWQAHSSVTHRLEELGLRYPRVSAALAERPPAPDPQEGGE